MIRYIIKRLLQLIPILVGITFLSFAMMRLAGGDAVTYMYENAGSAVSQEVIDETRKEYGLDQPFLVQYAKWFAGKGYDLIMTGRRKEVIERRAQEIRDKYGCRVIVILVDLARDDGVKKLLASLEGREVHVLVNNAGVAPRVRADLLEMSEESFDYVLGVNTKGNMFLTQAVAKQMIRQAPLDGRKGVIVNVSSCSSVVSSVNRGEYCVSKAGVSMLTTLYADRLAQEGILVHEVRPGVIATDMTSAVQDKYDKMIGDGMFPIARWGTPQDVANAVSALCSDKFLYTTGNYIDVDGGFHIKRL